MVPCWPAPASSAKSGITSAWSGRRLSAGLPLCLARHAFCLEIALAKSRSPAIMDFNEHVFADVWSGQCGPIDAMEKAAWKQGERAMVQAMSDAIDAGMALPARAPLPALARHPVTAAPPPAPARLDARTALLGAARLSLQPLPAQDHAWDLRERA